MTDVTLHTPLEILLFFQSLRTLGVEASSFSKISDLLKENEYIHDSETYAPDRLTADSLRQLYLKLLKEEVRIQRTGRNSPVKDGDQNPRKRKLSTPPIYTVDEAAEHIHLLPQLIDRLYARYRNHMILAIEDEERKYRSLQKDIHEIELGEWDGRLQQKENHSGKESKGVSSIQTLLRHEDDDDPNLSSGKRHEETPKERPGSAGLNEPATHPSSTTTALGDVQSNNQSSIRAEVSRPSAYHSHHSRNSSATGVQQPLSPHHENFQSHSRPSSQSRMSDGHVPYLPPIGYNMPSPTSDAHRRLPHQQAQIGTPLSPSPRLNQVPLIPAERSSGSPIILPPPPGMLRSSGSPAGPLDALADMASQQYRTNPAIPSPRLSQAPGSSQHLGQLPQPRNYMQRAYPYYDSQVPYAAQYPTYSPHSLPPYHHPNQPAGSPYQNPNHGHTSTPRQQSQQYQASLIPYIQYQGHHPVQDIYQSSPSVPTTPRIHSRSATQETHSAASTIKKKPPRPSPINTFVSSTKWKHLKKEIPNKPPGSPTRPESRDISPISEKAPSPIPESISSQDKDPRNENAKQSPTKDHEQKAKGKPSRNEASSKKTRGGRSRGSTSRKTGVRAGSTASSALAGSIQTRTRSQSIASHTDELSIDNNQNTSRRIKPEPPATPVTIPDDLVSTASTPIQDPSRKAPRYWRNTLRSLDSAEPTRSSTKRKRAGTLEQTPDVTSTSTPIPRSNLILTSRNFPRTSGPIMNDIAAHKLASIFAKPLTERDAPGYKDLIYRPQDLKSIKSAISAGSRAIATAVDRNTPADDVSSPGRNAANLWVEGSRDVVPPKGIVNSAQLEKEICRMFANAVMFNPDTKRGLGPAFRTRSKVKQKENGDEEDSKEEGDTDADGGRVVRDTREMFGAVEEILGVWRAAERVGEEGRGRGEESERDELAGEEGDNRGRRGGAG